MDIKPAIGKRICTRFRKTGLEVGFKLSSPNSVVIILADTLADFSYVCFSKIKESVHLMATEGTKGTEDAEKGALKYLMKPVPPFLIDIFMESICVLCVGN